MKKPRVLSVVLPLIRVVRGQRVILDADLARLYGVPTRYLNQQLRRNRARFPGDFAFKLTPREAFGKRSQIVIASRNRNLRMPPIAYTEHGAVMAANVLKSKRAVVVSIEVVRAFVQLRRIASAHDKIAKMLSDLERAVTKRLDKNDREIETLFGMMTALIGEDPENGEGKRRIGTA